MLKFRNVVFGVILAAAPHWAFANDSMSELAAGGIQLVKTDAIAMSREDLYLSEGSVRVRYEMLNKTDRPITTLVAFPMPEVPHRTPAGFATKAGGYNIPFDAPNDPNFMDFKVTVNGRAIDPRAEIKAMLGGKDIAKDLMAIGGAKLALQPGEFMQDETPIDDGVKNKLMALGAFQAIDELIYRLPWTSFVTFYWEQTFEPGLTLVEHSYRPIIGRNLIYVARGRLQGGGVKDLKSAFCVDSKTDKALMALARKQADGGPLFGSTLAYIVKTGGNWRGGRIGEFSLTIQGEEKTDITSLCTGLPLVKTGKNRFEARVKNYAPKDNLKILFVRATP